MREFTRSKASCIPANALDRSRVQLLTRHAGDWIQGQRNTRQSLSIELFSPKGTRHSPQESRNQVKVPTLEAELLSQFLIGALSNSAAAQRRHCQVIC